MLALAIHNHANVFTWPLEAMHGTAGLAALVYVNFFLKLFVAPKEGPYDLICNHLVLSIKPCCRMINSLKAVCV